ncbi:MAG: hypothetical protein HZB67_04095 [Candidatus Aenigmarchaeota archaeon]|nr:hypothetical protein [Candidatus Aenigmarchaeota archaeon]
MKSEKGLANLEFIISVAIFITVVSFVTITVFNTIPRLHSESVSEDMKARVYQISEALMSRGYPENWADDVKRFGLVEDDHVLSAYKIDLLDNICKTVDGYKKVRDSFSDYSIKIEVSDVDGNNFLICEPPVKIISTEFSLERVAVLRDSMKSDSSTVLLLHLNNDVAYGETATYFNDFSGNGNSFSCADPSCPISVDGKFKNALEFDGSNDYIIKNPFGGFSGNAISVEFWIKTAAGGDGIISYAVVGASTEFLISDSSGIRIYRNSSYVDTNVAVNDNKWHFIAVTWDGNSGNTIVYKDGKKSYEGSLAQGKAIISGGSMVIGQNQGNVGDSFQAGQEFIGVIDEIKISNKVKTFDEILNDYGKIARMKITIMR